MPEWTLVGRSDDLKLLRDLLTGSETRSAVLAGPPGVGKTRLGHECLGIAERLGHPTAHISGSRSAAQIPFGAVAPLLHEPSQQSGEVEDRVELLRQSVATLADQSEDRRLLLFVDDAHLLDDASATFVHQVAATDAATVLATVQTGVPAPDPVVALWKDGLAERVEVDEIAADAIAELLQSVLGGPVDPATAAEFSDRCQGNALFLRELVMGALDDDSLRADDGIWRLEQPLSPSARLVEIVEARLGRLEEDERALMELAAYGEPLGLDEVATLSDPAIAEALERRDLLSSHAEGRRVQIHLAHPIYGDVVRARTPGLRVRAIAESLADALELTQPLTHDDVLRVATWRLLAGGGDADMLLDGAAIARWRYDFALAEELARAAVDAGAGFDAALLAARLAGLQGRRDEASGELTELAGKTTDDEQRGQVAIARFDNRVWSGHGDLAILGEAQDAVADPGWDDRFEARRLGVLLVTEGPRVAAAAALDFMAHATGEALALASTVAAFSLARLGRLDEALDVSAQGQAASEQLRTPLPWYPWWHTVTTCLALRYAGRFEEADELIAVQHDRAIAEGSAEAQALFALLGASATGDRGRVRTAAGRAREALAINQRLGRPLLVRRDHIAGAQALALAGLYDEAAAHLDALDELAVPLNATDEVDLIQARAWTTAASGDLPGARAELQRAAELAARLGDLVAESAALHGAARLGDARIVWPRLAELAERIEGELAPARAAHVTALARSDAPALATVAEDFAAMGADLLAAEAAADAAVVWQQDGEMRDAVAARRRAGELAERCEDPVTPALHAIDTRVRLTPSERETAVLAAGGRSNKEIAEQLYLSARTVENRLQRVYEKLGISRRTELAEVLSPES